MISSQRLISVHDVHEVYPIKSSQNIWPCSGSSSIPVSGQWVVFYVLKQRIFGSVILLMNKQTNRYAQVKA